jgi:Secretion system C-terminal sorting domain
MDGNIGGMNKTYFMKTRIIILLAFISLFGQTGYSQLTLAGFSGQLLSTGTVSLNWQTMMEVNNKYFIVERSSDGIEFQALGQVVTQQNDSTHAFELDYNFTDKSPLPGTSYYRLEMIAKDGNSTFTNVIQVYNQQLQGIKVYPTIVENNSLFVETDKSIKNARMEVYDLSGKMISESAWQELSGRQNFSLVNNVSRLSSGTYVVRLTANGENLIHQLIIVQSR